MPNFNQEIGNVPVGQLAASTFTALSDAEWEMQLRNYDVFQKIMFDDQGDVEYSEFTYQRANPDYGTDPQNPGEPTIDQRVQLPTGLFMPGPSLGIDSATFEMEVELNSMEYERSTKSTSAEAKVDFRAKLGWWGRLNISGKVAHKRTTLSGSEVKRRYGLKVVANLKRQERPEIVDRVFNLLVDGIPQPQSE